MLSGESYAAELGRVVLTSQLYFLFSSDADWARQNILPLLDWSVDARRADQAWHGFLSGGKWSEALLPDLLPLYEGAFAHVPDLPQRLRRQYSKHLAGIAVYGSSNPLQEGWLRRFLNAVEPEDRAAWASEVGLILRQLEGEAVRDLWDGWLGEYWSRRNSGIPLPLEPDELEEGQTTALCGLTLLRPGLDLAGIGLSPVPFNPEDARPPELATPVPPRLLLEPVV